MPIGIILDAPDWDTCFSRATELESNQNKGDLFDRLTQLYLQVAPKYQRKLKNVWLLKDVPARIRKDLNLPELDRGIFLKGGP